MIGDIRLVRASFGFPHRDVSDFRYNKKFKAENGENGSGARCTGKSGEDTVVKVPKGTIVKEIDGYKKEIKEDFDEIQYLIKFTNNTEKLITRHKNVINGIFKGAGLSKKNIDDKSNDNNNKLKRTRSQSKSKIQGYLDIVKEVDKMEQEYAEDEDIEDYDDEFLTTSVSQLNGVFYKMKKINQIKDNLCNIQDDCLGYHEKLKNTLKRSESAKPPTIKEEQKI